jgi:hypothetical protein
MQGGGVKQVEALLTQGLTEGKSKRLGKRQKTAACEQASKAVASSIDDIMKEVEAESIPKRKRNRRGAK